MATLDKAMRPLLHFETGYVSNWHSLFRAWVALSQNAADFMCFRAFQAKNGTGTFPANSLR
ncbi:hypothetical protein [Polaromonas naphthalenivorans]|uniref:hypothetical protein n=1 Tax=Polaromonas naphthalenivorans TaxID=216465 RepID=UPI0012EE02C0|nr:hypothetical protein [Polaromonas naphthalenivorans]